MDGISNNTKIIAVTPWWQMALNILLYSCVALTVVSSTLLVLDMIPRKKKES